jgi:hypothetical protein
MIDVMLAHDTCYRDELEAMDEGALMTALPDPHELGNHPEAQLN